jgi:hypothetical protein
MKPAETNLDNPSEKLQNYVYDFNENVYPEEKLHHHIILVGKINK